MYKNKEFRVRPFESIAEDFCAARSLHPYVERIFLADGDALCLSTDKLMRILDIAGSTFPECTRVSAYSRSSHILRKSEGELKRLREAGLGIVYIGAESGSDEVLRLVDKGETAAQIVEACQKTEAAGIAASVTFVSGLGGKALMVEHAAETGKMIGKMGASFVGLLTLVLTPGTPMHTEMLSGAFAPLSAREVLEELDLILVNADCDKDCVLRSNHPSNLVALKGTLPHDKERLLSQVRQAKTDERVTDIRFRNRHL